MSFAYDKGLNRRNKDFCKTFCRRSSQVQLMGGEFLETALYWAGVVSVRLGAITEKKVSQHSSVSGVQCGFDHQSISCFIRRLELILIICSE